MLIGIEASHANKIRRTGVEESCWQIIQNLKKIIPEEVNVVLYSNKPLRGELGVLPKNWRIKILSWPLKKMWSQTRLLWELLIHPPDVFFAPGQLIPFFSFVDTVVYLHDSAFLAYPKAYNFLSRAYLKWMNQLIIKKAKIIITSTEFNKKELVKYYGKEIKDNVRVVPLAYDGDKYQSQNYKYQTNVQLLNTKVNPDVLKKYSLEKPYIISIGRLEEKKNTHRLIRAFNLLKNKYPISNYKLILIGSRGVGYKEIKKELASSIHRKDIIVPGWVHGDDLPDLLRFAELFVFASLYEGFGLPVLESMACGCPVVAADIPSLREVGGEAVIYTNPTNSANIVMTMENILFDQTLRQEKIVAGFERVKFFSWEKTANEICKIIC